MKSKNIILSLFIIINTVVIISRGGLEARAVIVDDGLLKTHQDKEISTYNTGDYAVEVCPPPTISLVSNNYGNGSDIGRFCSPQGCCIPCPLVNNFYKSDQVNSVYSILNPIRIISFVCVLFITLSYLLLPNKRDHAGTTVLFFHMSLLTFLGIISIHTNQNKGAMCHDDITRATISNDPIYCGLQGITLIFSTFLLVLFCSLLILQLHFQAVWKSNLIQKNYKLFLVPIFITALIFTLLPVITKEIGYDFGPVCMVNSAYKNWFFWYPLTVFVIPGFMMHIWTIIHMAELYWISSRATITNTFPFKPFNNKRMRAQDLLAVLKMQWRVLMLAVIYLTSFIFYQLFVVLEVSKLDVLKLPTDQRPKWIAEWTGCIFNGNGQDVCSRYSIPNIPNINMYVMSEGVIGSLGISLFIVFGTSKNLWVEWKHLLINGFSFKRNKTDSFNDGSHHSQQEES